MKRRYWSRSRGFTLLDLLAVMVICVVSLPFLSSCRTTCRTPANRVKCASNLRQIGQALLLYANENKGTYPRVTYLESKADIPEWGSGISSSQPFAADGPIANDVTAAMFLLLRTQDITSEVFICPSSDEEKDQYDGKLAQDRSNFTDVAKNLSYSYANPYPNAKTAEKKYVLNSSLSAEFAVAADFNPGMAGGNEFNVTTVKVDAPSSQMRHANSLNHDGDGQNVLYGDGHVEFLMTPFVGIAYDNIYTAGTGGIYASPVDANDSVLLPAAE